MKFSYIFLFLLFSVFCITVFAAEVEAGTSSVTMEQSANDKARDTLFNSLKATVSASMSATAYYPSTGHLRAKLYRKCDSGNRLFQRLESYSTEGRVLTYILRGDDLYVQFGDEIFHIKWNVERLIQQTDPLRSVIPQLMKIDKMLDCQYTMEDSVYKDTPSYKITMTISFDDDKLRTFFGLSAVEFNKNRKQFDENCSTVVVAYVDKDNNMLSSLLSRSKTGKVLGNVNWDSVDELKFNDDIPDSLFAVPENIPVIKTQEELQDIFVRKTREEK